MIYKKIYAASAVCVLFACAGCGRFCPFEKSKLNSAESSAGLNSGDSDKAEENIMKWEGSYSNKDTQEALIINNVSAWETLWKKAVGENAPAVDFFRYEAAAVFAGRKNTGGFSVEFSEPEIRGDKKVVRYVIKSPGSGSFAAQALTQPYCMRIFEKDGKRILLEEIK